MTVSTEVREFISSSLPENNRSLLAQISKLVADSAESVKRSSVEAADEQLREIKKLRREEPKSFKRKGTKFITNSIKSCRITCLKLSPTSRPMQLTKSKPPCQKVCLW